MHFYGLVAPVTVWKRKSSLLTVVPGWCQRTLISKEKFAVPECPGKALGGFQNSPKGDEGTV